MTKQHVMYPPFRFAIVEENVFRGAYPKERNYQYLKRLGLKTILSLTPSPPTESLVSFCRNSGIQSIHCRVEKPKEDSIPLTFSKVSSILRFLLDRDNLPIYVHGLDGILVTGIVICCLRKVQCWGLNSIMQEYSRFLSDDGIQMASAEETEFVERFQTEMEVHTSKAPSWLIVPTKKHPFLKIRYVQGNDAASVALGAPSQLSSSSDLDLPFVLASSVAHQISPPASLSASASAAAFKAEKDLLRRKLHNDNRKQPQKKSSDDKPPVSDISLGVKALALENHF